MNRKHRREMDKYLGKKLSKEQYEDLKSDVIREKVEEESKRFIANFIEVFKPTMREFHISEERANSIIKDIYKKANEKYNNGDLGDSQVEGAVDITDDVFIEKGSTVLKKYNIANPEKIAREIYKSMAGEV